MNQWPRAALTDAIGKIQGVIMKNFITILAFSAAAAAVPGAALAQNADDKGFYIALNVGSASLKDPVVTYYDAGGTFGGTGTTDTATATLDTKSALAFGGTLGYDFGNVRSDVEFQYSRHKISSLTFTSVNGAATTLSAADRSDVCDYLEATTCGGSGNTFVFDGSRVRQLSAMANLWLDLPVGGSVVPYAGGGVGISGFEVDGEGKGKFAWQLGAGVAVKLSHGVALTADYRHREVAKTRVDFDNVSGFDVGKLKTDTIAAGLRFTF